MTSRTGLLGRAMSSAVLALIVAATSLAAQTPETLDRAVREAVGARWALSPDSIVVEWGARRASPQADDVSVELVGTGAGGHWVVRLRAPGGDVEAVRMRAGHSVVEPVATRRLGRGDTLEVADIGARRVVRWGAPTGDVTPVVAGWVAQRVLDAGDPLTSPAVRPPWAVEAGRPVALVWRRGGLRLRVDAVAAGSAAVGEQIYVRTESGKRMRGLVAAPGVVDVTSAGGLGGGR